MASDTKQRILNTAGKLFAEHGVAGTSLRQITAMAGVNLASIHYHFHSKQALLKAVLAQRIEPINERRLHLLDAAERDAGPEGPKLEKILEAFLMPVFEQARDPEHGGTIFLRLFGLLYGESGDEIREYFLEIMGPIADRFSPAFQRALPELPREEILWRIYFSIGVMAHILRGGKELSILSRGLLAGSKWEAAMPRVIEFLAGGLRAPSRFRAAEG